MELWKPSESSELATDTQPAVLQNSVTDPVSFLRDPDPDLRI